MKNLKEVDWSRAPEGATHYNVGCCFPWLKETPPSYFADGDWIEHSVSTHILAMSNLRNAVKRPQEEQKI